MCRTEGCNCDIRVESGGSSHPEEHPRQCCDCYDEEVLSERLPYEARDCCASCSH